MGHELARNGQERIQSLAMVGARLDYEAPIKPQDVDAIVDDLISVRGATQTGDRRVALVVKQQQTS
jgi:hypothetical protein